CRPKPKDEGHGSVGKLQHSVAGMRLEQLPQAGIEAFPILDPMNDVGAGPGAAVKAFEVEELGVGGFELAEGGGAGVGAQAFEAFLPAFEDAVLAAVAA